MSLQVWLPLNKEGDFKNKGLADVTVTNNGATYDANGKIGGCYLLNPTRSGSDNSRLELNCTQSKFLTAGLEFSLSCWFKLTGDNYSNGSGLIACNLYKNNGFGLYLKTNRTLNFMICSASSETEWLPTMTAISMNTWTHVCATYKNRVLSLYVNGILIGTNTTSFDWTLYPRNILIGLGTQGGWGYSHPGCINDVRIYSHCLSPKEVKEISKGLVLHYPLDDAYVESTTNLGGSSINYNTKTEGETFALSGWGGDSGTCECYRSGGYNNGPYKVYHKNISTGSGSGGVFCKTQNDITIVAGKTYTMSIYVKASKAFIDTAHSFNINGVCGSDTNHYITYGKNVPFTTDWTRLERTFTATEADAGTYGEMSIVYKCDTEAIDVYYSCFQIEEKSYATPYTPTSRNLTIVYDSSGYSRTGQVSGSLQVEGDSPRYDKCTYLVNGAKINTTIPALGNNYSVAWWAKYSIGANMPWGFSNGNRINPLYNLCLNTGDGSDNPWYSSGTTKITAPSSNVWHHYVITGDGTDSLLYVDGEPYGKAKTFKPLTGTSLYINGWDSGSSYLSNPYLSDFRIYSTALPPADIKELYNTSGIIDDLGDVMGYLFVEEGSPEVNKYGLIKALNMSEKMDLFNKSYVNNLNVTSLTWTSNNSATIVTKTGTSYSGFNLSNNSSSPHIVPYGMRYRLEFDIQVPSLHLLNIDMNNSPIMGDAWSGNDNDQERGYQGGTIPANTWTHILVTGKNIKSGNTNKIPLRIWDYVGINTTNDSSTITYYVKNIKFYICDSNTEATFGSDYITANQLIEI